MPPRAPLRSKNGCDRCLARKKKCDEVRPTCGACKRLFLLCRWDAADHGVPRPARKPLDAHALVHNQDTSFPSWMQAVEPPLVSTFDHPRLVRGSCAMAFGDGIQIALVQYLLEQGHTISRHAYPDVPQFAKFNVYKIGLRFAMEQPSHLYALFAVASAHWQERNETMVVPSQKFYGNATAEMRQLIGKIGDEGPSELLCTTSLALSWFEMIHFKEPEVRIVHLMGYHNLWQRRLRAVIWPGSPYMFHIETYTYVLSTSALFIPQMVPDMDSPDYIERVLLPILETAPKPVPGLACGVPFEILTSAYRLAVYRHQRFISGVSLESIQQSLESEISRLMAWSPPTQLQMAPFKDSLLLTKLYRAACLELATFLLGPNHYSDNLPKVLDDNRKEMTNMLIGHSWTVCQPISIGWPLFILACAASNRVEHEAFLAPIVVSTKVFGFGGFQTIIDTARKAFAQGPNEEAYLGLRILEDNSELRSVHV